MKRVLEVGEDSAVSEIAIVDTFTKLIFGEQSAYSENELHIIQTLRSVDEHCAMDQRCEMGVYLRALGVREMIGLVTRVRSGMLEGASGETPGRGSEARDSRGYQFISADFQTSH
jgi:hypothetical protein